MELVLASASPRRQELLRQIGCNFTVVFSDIIENNSQDLPPIELAVSQARAKALDVASRVDAEQIVIGADTIVTINGQIFGKPVDYDDARRMLTELSGREHQVITGISVVKEAKCWQDYEITRVKIRQLSPDEIERYILTGEPMDKAGAYAIQGIGALLIENIEGCYTNVVGLPLVKLAVLLKKAGFDLL